MNKQNGAVVCPSCQHSNKEGSSICVRCYYQIDKPAFDQDPTMEDSESTDLLDLLASEIEESDSEEAMPASFSMDDVTVEIDQYVDDDQVTLSQSSNIESLLPKPSQEPEEIYELTEADVPSFVKKFEIPITEEIPTEIEESSTKPIELVQPTAETPKSVEVVSASDVPDPVEWTNPSERPATPDPADFDGDGKVDEFEAAFAKQNTISSDPFSSPSKNGEVPNPIPRAPQLSTIPTLQSHAIEIENEVISENYHDKVTTQSEEAQHNPDTPLEFGNNAQFWPWIQQDEWSPSEIKQQLLASMKAAKEQNFAEATVLLDDLGPHLGKKTQLLYSVSRLLIAIGRQQDAENMIDKASKHYPNDANVSLARQKLVS